jgi:hypothetical protein
VFQGSDFGSFFPAVPSSGLYFTLGSTVYLPGDTVLITDIEVFVGVPPGVDPVDPGTSLVCRTELVNTLCCRGADGGNVGEWFDPGGTQIPRFGRAITADFSRSAYTHQVRLNRRNNAMSPTGVFECRVPPMGGGALVVASITITSGQCIILKVHAREAWHLCRCIRDPCSPSKQDEWNIPKKTKTSKKYVSPNCCSEIPQLSGCSCPLCTDCGVP